MTYRLYLAYFIFILSLFGCQPHVAVEHSLREKHISSSLNDAEVFVLVPQKQLFASFSDDTWRSYGAGFEMNMILNALSSRMDSGYRRMQKNVAHVAEVTADISWGKDLADSLRHSGIFPNPQSIKLVEGDIDDERVSDLVKSTTRPWAIVVHGEYHLDTCYRVLTIGAKVSLYRQGEVSPRHSLRSVYYSKPITPECELEVTGKYAELWAANHGAELRKQESTGVKSIADLIRSALLDRPSNMVTEADTVKVYFDWDNMQYNNPQNALRSAKQVGASDVGFILVDEDGRFLSTPRIESFATANESQRLLETDMSRVYVYQDGGTQGYAPELYDNGKSVGTIYPFTYFTFDIPPGKHSFTLHFGGNDSGSAFANSVYKSVQTVIVDAAAGERKVLYFKGFYGTQTDEDALIQKTFEEAEGEMINLVRGY